MKCSFKWKGAGNCWSWNIFVRGDFWVVPVFAVTGFCLPGAPLHIMVVGRGWGVVHKREGVCFLFLLLRFFSVHELGFRALPLQRFQAFLLGSVLETSRLPAHACSPFNSSCCGGGRYYHFDNVPTLPHKSSVPCVPGDGGLGMSPEQPWP